MTLTPVQITGNLTHDPDITYLDSGRPVARFSVAVNSRKRNPAGDGWVDGEPTFYPCSAWGELAEHVAESLTRGARVVVLGAIAARSWTPSDGPSAGVTLTRLEVTADVVAASLQWADVTITKPARTGTGGPRTDPWASAPVAATAGAGYDEEPPF